MTIDWAMVDHITKLTKRTVVHNRVSSGTTLLLPHGDREALLLSPSAVQRQTRENHFATLHRPPGLPNTHAVSLVQPNSFSEVLAGKPSPHQRQLPLFATSRYRTL